MKSETVAGVALFLGLHTGMLSEATQLSLVVTTLLAGGAAFFLAANRWVIVPLSTVVAVYMTHASLALSAQPAVEPSTTLAFLAIDFGLFSLAWLIRPNQRTLLLPIVALNWFGLVALGARVLIPMSQDTAFTFLCSAALVHAALAGLARLRGAPASLVALLLGLAIATAGIALPVNLHGWLLVGGWIFLAFGAAAAARSRATWGGFSGIAIVLLTIATAEAVLKLEDPAAIAICLAAWVAVERGHAPSNRLTESRWLLVAGATLTLAALGRQVVPPEGHAIAGVVAALILFATGFALTARAYRWAAFATLAIAAARFLTVQLAQLSATSKIATFATAGVILLAVSYAYTRVSAKR